MKPDIKILEPAGILDGTQAESFRQQVDVALDEDIDVLLIDLKDITFIDSSGLGVLVVILKQVRATGKQMYVCSVNDQVRMLFELTSMDRVFEVFPDVSTFKQSVTALSGA